MYLTGKEIRRHFANISLESGWKTTSPLPASQIPKKKEKCKKIKTLSASIKLGIYCHSNS